MTRFNFRWHSWSHLWHILLFRWTLFAVSSFFDVFALADELGRLLGLFLFPFFYPVGFFRKKGWPVLFQRFLVNAILFVVCVFSEWCILCTQGFVMLTSCLSFKVLYFYWIVFPSLSIPALMSPPTIMGGTILLFSGLCYGVAAIRKEKSLTSKDIINGKWLWSAMRLLLSGCRSLRRHLLSISIMAVYMSCKGCYLFNKHKLCVCNFCVLTKNNYTFINFRFLQITIIIFDKKWL